MSIFPKTNEEILKGFLHAPYPSREVGVHGNEPLAERVHPEAESFECLRSEKLRRLLGSEKGKNGAFMSLKPNLDLGHIPNGSLARCKDYPLCVNGPIPKGDKQAPWKREI